MVYEFASVNQKSYEGEWVFLAITTCILLNDGTARTAPLHKRYSPLINAELGNLGAPRSLK